MAMNQRKTLDFTILESPPVLDEEAQKALISECKTVELTVAGNTLKIHTEQVRKKGAEPTLNILFLHGQRFSSSNWLDIKSLHHVANWGYQGFAIDLPGYGKSVKPLEAEHEAEFLKILIDTLGLSRIVIVSPSMSGSFSLPFLFRDGKSSTDRAVAYVPVAPVITSKFVDQFKESQIPTLVVCGSNDTMIGTKSTRDLLHLSGAVNAPIEGAGHACYLDNPDAFHTLLHYFLKNLKA